MSEQTRIDDGRHDFDFLHGRWRVRGRRLLERLVGCTDWMDLDAECECWPMLGGLANADELASELFRDRAPTRARSTTSGLVVDSPLWFSPGFRGMTVRLFDPKARQWAIYWADNRNGVLDPPVRGGFAGDVGTFSGGDFHAGRAILSRFTWRRGESPRWEQAFSADGGHTWETNWTMDFTRAPANG
jgi:hypothetical protein